MGWLNLLDVIDEGPGYRRRATPSGVSEFIEDLGTVLGDIIGSKADEIAEEADEIRRSRRRRRKETYIIAELARRELEEEKRRLRREAIGEVIDAELIDAEDEIKKLRKENEKLIKKIKKIKKNKK